jgi:hypothetical protein
VQHQKRIFFTNLASLVELKIEKTFQQKLQTLSRSPTVFYRIKLHPHKSWIFLDVARNYISSSKNKSVLSSNPWKKKLTNETREMDAI